MTDLRAYEKRIAALEDELEKSRKIQHALKERVKRSMRSSGGTYSLFEDNVALVEAVRHKTRDLEAALADAESAARAKSDFLANMSHELRTPMNGILGTASILRETELDPMQSECADVIHRSAESLLTVLGNILDFSTLETNGFELHASAFDPTTVVEAVRATIAERFADHDVPFTCHVDPDVVGDRTGDPYRLHQVLFQIASNAMKFTETGRVELRVDRPMAAESRDRVRFRVVDTGVGIAPGDRDRIFESFAQADASTTRVHGGVGLGLSIAQRLVRAMGGEIQLESVPGEGSTFAFELDLPAVARDDPVDPVSA